MNNNQLFIVYDDNGVFKGFYNDEIVVQSILENDHYCVITEDMRNYMLSHLPYVKVKTNLIYNTPTIVNSTEYLELISTSIDIDKIKKRFISKIKSTCGSYIIQGINVVLTNGEDKHFSYKVEDQINLKELVDNHSQNEHIYYHATGEFDIVYSYDDIVTIHNTLYNNKLYNQIYTQVLCEWINDKYTLEMYEDKNCIVDYGYTNDEITAEVLSRYEQQKIS